MNDQTRNTATSHLAGPFFLAAIALIYDIVVIKLKRPTISSGVRWITSRNLGPEAAGAIIGLLLFHWFIKENK